MLFHISLLLLLLLLLVSSVLGQNCGPKYNNQVCAANTCCSQYGWCDTGANYCDPATCLSAFSGPGSSCAKKSNPVTTTSKTSSSSASTGSTTTTSTTTATHTFATTVPDIDVCGHAQGGVACPGAGAQGYFYRCCSAAGHCGPKNDIQDAALYCGDGCQAGYGRCGVAGVSKPAAPSTTAPREPDAGEGETCGPIVDRKCAGSLCCSGSNFCGSGDDFCGAANWCQPSWGSCAGKRTV
ncbi:carbohydrate-binding module family 18 protein [Diplodia corticola]|uniref:Carbohydrate-binding module family 18 protein n=1 Tax=Diplodia corticola TaxID=236234 RepID=A0A1J9RP99_9PEZI|nr:carbohydrate-binding module family 18 protein [Diplodia corticola]OJD34379.1 carbohydrate-binding module family 18 protein [Diplodia corticola]